LRTRLSSSPSFTSPDLEVHTSNLSHLLVNRPPHLTPSSFSPTNLSLPIVFGVAALDLCSGVIPGDNRSRCGVSDGQSWNAGFLPCPSPNLHSAKPSRFIALIRWIRPKMLCLGRSSTICFKLSPIDIVAHLDRLISSSFCDYFRSCNAEYFELFLLGR